MENLSRCLQKAWVRARWDRRQTPFYFKQDAAVKLLRHLFNLWFLFQDLSSSDEDDKKKEKKKKKKKDKKKKKKKKKVLFKTGFPKKKSNDVMKSFYIT